MHRHLIIAAGAAAFCVSACAATTQTDRQALVDAGELTGETSDGDRVRCETVRVTGSRLSERICLTQREWDQMEENAQQARRDRDEQHNVVLPEAGGGGPSR